MKTDLVVGAIQSLASRRPVFWSEADFQHELAWELRHRNKNMSIRLERSFTLASGRIHVDGYVEWRRERWGIELKYRTSKARIEVGGECFELREQSAEDTARYDFVKDVSRLEQMKAESHITAGIAVLLTNCGRLWRRASRSDVNDAAFRIHDGRTLHGALAWAKKAAPGSIKSRESAIVLAGRYALELQDYSEEPAPKNGRLRFVAVGVQ